MGTQTLAAVLTAPRAPVEVAPVPVREPGPGEVLVRMEACGLCHSDLFVAGLEKLPLAPVVLGHEGIGRVAEVGAGVKGWARGDRAGITSFADSCGGCEYCRGGRGRFCAQVRNFGYSVHGALAALATVPVAQLCRVPESLPAAIAAPLCCAGWTAYAAVRETRLRPGQTVALFGMGGLGHLAIQYARQAGLRVVAVDAAEPKLDQARAAGAELAVAAQNAARALQKQCGGVDGAIVLTASIAAFPEAFRSLKRTGVLVMVGLNTDRFEVPVVEVVLKGIQLRGSYLGTPEDMEAVFRLAETGGIRPHVTTHALAEVPLLVEQMRRGEIQGRAVIAF